MDGATGTCQVSSQRGGCSEEVIIFDEAEDSFFREKFQVVDVAGYAFKDCNNLKTLIVAGHIDKYGEYCFFGCRNLTYIDLPYTVEYIGGAAFQLCEKLQSIYLGSSLTKIFGYTFAGCTKLTNVYISGNLTLIGDYAFHECKSLKTIDIPESVEVLGKSAFRDCISLSSIKIPPVNSIQSSTFRGCSSLTAIDIPTSVKIIDEYAFSNCPSLQSVRCVTSKPCSLTQNAFDWETYNSALLYVPAGSKELYAKTEGWKNFKNIEEETSGITDITVDGVEDIVVHDLQGIRLPIKSKEDLNLLSPGYYIVNNKITQIKR